MNNDDASHNGDGQMADYDPSNLETALDRAADPTLIKFVTGPELFWLWDVARSRIIWANPAALKFWTAESVVELAARDQSTSVHGNRQLDRIARTLRDGAGCLERLRFFRHGREVLLTCKVTADRLDDSRILRVQSMGAKEPKLGTSEVLEAIIASVPTPALLVQSNGKIVAANADARQIGFDIDDGEINLGQQIVDITAGDDRFVGRPMTVNIAAISQKFMLSVRKLVIGNADVCPDDEPLIVAALAQFDDQVEGPGGNYLEDDSQSVSIPNLQSSEGPSETIKPEVDRDAPTEGVDDDGEDSKLTVHDGDEESDDSTTPSESDQEPKEESGRDNKKGVQASGAAALVAAVNDAFGREDETQSQSDTKNIVPFRGHDSATAESTQDPDDTERDAFQAIADALGARLERSQSESNVLSGDSDPDQNSDSNIKPDGTLGKMPDQQETRSLLARLPIAILVYRGSDARGVSEPIFANRALLGLFGYNSVENIKRAGGVAAILPKSDSPQHQGKHFGDIAVVGDQPTPIDGFPPEYERNGENRELFVHDSSGIRIPVNARLQAVKWDGKNAMMLSILKTDHTKLAGAKVHDLNGRDHGVQFESILDQVLDAYLILDTAGIVKSMNSGAKTLFAVEDVAIVGKPFSRLLRAPSDHQAEIMFASIRDNNLTSNLGDGCEVIARVPGGADMPYLMKIHPLEKAGNSLFCAIFSDISRWKTVAQEQTDARELAERNNEQKTTFLAKISHEIRTPLNSILGFSDAILEEEFGKMENPQYLDYVNNINESGKHLLSLINDLLDLSKVEAGKMELDFSSVNLNEVAAGSIKLMQADANKARIIIRSNLASNLADVVADQRSLRQICLNLLSNAIKFTGPGGQVIVASRLTENGEIELRVQDTGTGMNNRELEAALEPFRQLDNQFDDTPGTGLGLPLTKALVEENRARFDIASSKGQGTLVKVTFPINRVLAD